MVAKVQGNIVDTLMPPLSPLELVLGYVAGAVARGLLVAVAIWVMMALFIGLGLPHPLWALAFIVLGGAFLGGLGMLAAIYANKFDQMAAITNFIITPLSFLSGTFYSLEALPPAMRALSYANPVFYLIDGVRFGLIGRSDSSPVLGIAVVTIATVLVLLACWAMFRGGRRLKP
jgi:ABC-2 type transport system permease protein